MLEIADRKFAFKRAVQRPDKQTPEQEKFVIGNSLIQGRGLIALRRFDSSEVIFSTRHYDVSRLPRRGSVERRADEHILETSVLMWVNHSCSPNSRVSFAGRDVRLIAQKTIMPGEEIVCDYLATESRIPIPFRCRCQSCRSRLICGCHQ